MIYFRSLSALKSFVSKKLINKEKSEYNFLDSSTQRLVLKNSSVDFHTEEDIIEELKEQGYIFHFKREIKPWLSDVKDVGFIFLYTKLKKDIKQQDIFAETLKNDRLLTINQVAEFLSISRATVYNKIKEGALPVVDLFGQKRIQLKDLLDYINSKKKNYL
jgi:excisionase family DNA binding protein